MGRQEKRAVARFARVLPAVGRGGRQPQPPSGRFAVAHPVSGRWRALGTLRMVEASRDELILAVGLTPGVAYQIADDGTVTAEISGQGSEGLDGNGTV